MTKKNTIISIFLYLIFTILMIITISQKINYHVDEIYSYTLANNVTDKYISVEELHTYTPAENVFIESMSADNNHRFDYKNVFKNQKADVHPPLYYILLHTICSIFPETFSKWYAGIINIVFALLTFYYIRKLIYILLDITENSKKVALCIFSSAFIFSSGILSAISFLRMYIMAMCWVTIIAWLFAKQIGKQHTPKFYLSIFMITFLGALTHYYCIVYTVLTCLIYTLYLLWEKRWKETGVFLGIMSASGFLSIAIFPPMLTHMFSGYRGSEAIKNLGTSNDYMERLSSFFSFINKEVFGNWLSILSVFIFILILIYILKICLQEDSKCERISSLKSVFWYRYIIVSIPSILYFLIVAKMAAYKSNRYIFPIYAVTFAWILCLILELCKRLFSLEKSSALLCIMLSAIIVGSWENCKWDYLYDNTAQTLEKAANYSKVNCLCIYNPESVWKIQSTFCEVSNYNSITFISTSHIELLKDTIFYSANDEFVLLLVGMEDQEKYLEQIQLLYPQINYVEKIGKFSYGSSFYLGQQ